ncbi:hypothetical protein SO802_002996 [Lithocarpus litseifolius]|uniref:Uncharacterized protein n=1 Tax=Lithocarpus litseifolius TaxID=425828 RepID=A0AAW2DZD9_9ROSI
MRSNSHSLPHPHRSLTDQAAAIAADLKTPSPRYEAAIAVASSPLVLFNFLMHISATPRRSEDALSSIALVADGLMKRGQSGYVGMHGTEVDLVHSHTVSLDTGLDNYSTSDSGNLGPGPPSPTSIARSRCEESLNGIPTTSKKRFRAELGRLGRNIRQRLLCGFFANEGTWSPSVNNLTNLGPQQDQLLNPNLQQDLGS